MNYLAAIVSLAATTVLITQPGVAHDGAKGIVKQRMGQMSAMESNLKRIAGMIRSGDDFDRQEILHLVNGIAKHSGKSMTRLFPESSKGMRSEADPVIWEEWDMFRSGASDLFRKADNLAKITSAGHDRADLMTAIRQLAASCTSCHRKFRRPK